MADLCLLTVHAHPDDESSKGAATIAKYRDQGVRTVLVTATGGEEGDILNKAMEQPGIRERLAEVRRDELAAATAIIGYDEVVMLGYRDSGMPDSEANANPACFARAELDEAVGRLVEIIRREKPQVVVTYPQEQSGYPHPDHLRVNEISEIAFDAAGDPAAHPGLGEPWQPSKLYYVMWSAKRMMAMHAKYQELGLESPFDDERMARWRSAPEPTTVIDINGYADVTRRALIAHATQIDPNGGWFFGLPPDVADTLHPFEEYTLARDLTGRGPIEGAEDDLFAGLRGVTADASWAKLAVGAEVGDPQVEGEVELVVPPTAGRPRAKRASAGDDGPPTVRATLTLASGRVTAAAPGPASAAVCTLTLAAPDLADLLAGTEPSVLFMQGRLKVDGDLRTALALLKATAHPGFAAGLPRG